MMEIREMMKKNKVDVYLSVRKIEASEIDRIMPDDFRLVGLEEVREKYARYPAFRFALYTKSWILTAQNGLAEQGYQEMLPDGVCRPVDFDRFLVLPMERRAFYYPGDKQVIVSSKVLEGKYTCFVARADLETPQYVNVACVRDYSKTMARSELIASLRKNV